jgi:hypothetical protein
MAQTFTTFTPIEEAGVKRPAKFTTFTPLVEEKESQEPLGMPMGDDMGSAIMAAAQPKKQSVLEGIDMPEPTFDPAEANRLSRRDYAEEQAQKFDPRYRQKVTQGGPRKPPSAAELAGGMMQDANPLLRIKAKTAQSSAEGLGGLLRIIGDVAGSDTLAGTGEYMGKNAQEYQQAMGPAITGDIQGFGPKSVVPDVLKYTAEMGEGAASSLAQSIAASALGPAAVLPSLSAVSGFSQYNKARDAGQSVLDASINAALYAGTEYAGGKFVGLDKAASALKNLVNQGASAEAKKQAGDTLFKMGVREIPGELATYLGQTGVDLLPGIGLNPDLTMAEFVAGLRDTAVQAAMMGGTTAGVGKYLQSRAPQGESKIPSAEQMMRDRGFLISEPKPETPSAPATPPAGRIEPTFDPEKLLPPEIVTEPTDEKQKRVRALEQKILDLGGDLPPIVEETPPVAAEKQKNLLDLKQEIETPTIEKPAPVITKEETPPVDLVTKGKPVYDGAYTGLLPSDIDYDTPDFRLKQADAFGQDLMGELFQETDSYGRAAIKNKSLTNAYAEKKETLGAATDAANVAFGSGDFAPFAQYTRLYPKTAAKLRAHLNSLKVARPTLIESPQAAIAEEETIPFFGEDLTGKPMPDRPEVQELLTQAEEASKAAEQLSKRTAGTSLFKVLQGSLADSEMSELGGRSRQVGKNPFMSLVAKKGKPGSIMEDMVNSGALDLFLPENMRPGNPMYDNGESAAYIREKLIQGQYYTYDTEIEIRRVTEGIWDLDKLINEELSIDDINKEIELAFNEQREADLAAAEIVPESEARSAEQRKAAATNDELDKREAQLEREAQLNKREARLLEERKRLEEERLKLEGPTEEEVLQEEERKSKAAELDEREQIRKESEAGAEQFELTREEGRQDTTGNLFEQPEPETVAISPEQERKEALEQFERQLKVPIQPFYAKSANKTQLLKPVPLTNLQIKEILDLASKALDLGMPAAVLGNVTAAGSTRMDAIAIISSSGNLMTAKDWKTTSQGEKLQVIAHELGHSVDTGGGNISDKPNWAKAHSELESWYAKSADKTQHPFTYPFHPRYKGKIRPKMESFAQSFGYYFTSPEDLQKNAPEAYSQIQTVVERIQDGSQKARAAGTTERGTAAINVQPARATKNAEVQPSVGEKRPAVSANQGLDNRGAESVTRLPAFKRWFGNSKVVDADGKPLVVYHGTASDFSKFSKEKLGNNTREENGELGFFFTAKPFLSDSYAEIASKGGWSKKTEAGSPVIYPVYLSIKNPKRYDTASSFYRDADKFKGRLNEWRGELEQQGFDGVIVRGDFEEVIAFRPEQIKSAIGNNGEFNPESVEINASEKEKDTWLLGRDRLGRVGFGPGAIAYKTIANIANKVLDKLAMKPISPELGRAMRNMRAKVDLAKNKVAEVAADMGSLSADERNMISDIIEGELKAGVHPPQHVLNIAAAIQSMMSRQSKELVDLGMLSKEAANRWENKYLPRFYERQLSDSVNAWAKAAKEVFMKQPLMRGIRGSNLRSRGMYEVISVDDLPAWIDEGWEQRDAKFDPKKSTETVVWRDYTREERENMGEIRDAMFRFVMGYNASQRDIALGRLYKDLAKNYASDQPLEGYVEVPTGKAEGTGVPRYGALEGMYVPKEIMDHLSANDHAMAEGILKIYRAGLSKWKEGKTVLNPVSHANNVISNVTMAHFAGVSYWDAHKYAGAIKDLAKNDDMVKEAKEVGLFGGTFSQAELIKSMPPELRQMANMTDSALSRFGERIWDTLAFTVEVGGKKYGARPIMQWAYENEDLFFRYVIYRDARNRGMNPEDARDYSQEFIFTYDDLPKGARMVRDYGMPFFSYTYKVIPVLAQTALKYPWRYAAPATVAYTANAMMYAIAANLGGGEDDWWGKVLYKYITDDDFRKKAKELEANERRYLPEWMKGHSGILSTPKAIRMGVDEATNLPMFLDISRIFPGGDLLDANNNSGGVALIQPLTPSNPVLTSLVAMLANKDMFLGKDVTSKTDTDAEKATKRAGWLWKQITPAISVGNYHFDRAMNATANMTGKPITVDAGPLGVVSYTGVGKDGLPVQPKHAMLQTMGIKIRPYDLEMAKVFEESNKRSLVREIDFSISKLNRQEGRGVISPEAAEIEREKLRAKKVNIRQGLTLSGEEKE